MTTAWFAFRFLPIEIVRLRGYTWGKECSLGEYFILTVKQTLTQDYYCVVTARGVVMWIYLSGWAHRLLQQYLCENRSTCFTQCTLLTFSPLALTSPLFKGSTKKTYFQYLWFEWTSTVLRCYNNCVFTFIWHVNIENSTENGFT